MLKPYDPSEDANEPVPPQCRATVDRIQRALDGDAADLESDSHATACAACRERVRAARVLLSVLATPEPVAVPSGFANRVVGAMQSERRTQSRQRIFAVVGSIAVAAAVLVAVWIITNKNTDPKGNTPTPEIVQQQPEVAPPPREKVHTPPEVALAPEPRPARIGDQFAKAGGTLLDSKPFTDSIAAAPKLFDMLTGAFKMPARQADPMANMLEPARKTLAELPVAARSGLEPVTGTAEKALNRFLRDVGVKPNS